jgi:hypothetical protein
VEVQQVASQLINGALSTLELSPDTLSPPARLRTNRTADRQHQPPIPRFSTLVTGHRGRAAGRSRPRPGPRRVMPGGRPRPPARAPLQPQPGAVGAKGPAGRGPRGGGRPQAWRRGGWGVAARWGGAGLPGGPLWLLLTAARDAAGGGRVRGGRGCVRMGLGARWEAVGATLHASATDAPGACVLVCRRAGCVLARRGERRTNFGCSNVGRVSRGRGEGYSGRAGFRTLTLPQFFFPWDRQSMQTHNGHSRAGRACCDRCQQRHDPLSSGALLETPSEYASHPGCPKPWALDPRACPCTGSWG